MFSLHCHTMVQKLHNPEQKIKLKLDAKISLGGYAEPPCQLNRSILLSKNLGNYQNYLDKQNVDLSEKAFKPSNDLTTHNSSHNGERPLQCSICQKVFIQSYHLATHEHCHIGENPFKCRFCKKVLITPGELTTHKCSQCGEKSFQCCFCDKAFKTSSDLSTHKHIHNR